MQVFGDDLIYEDFKASDFGLILDVSFDGAVDSEENIALTPNITDVFVGEKPQAVYLSQQYSEHLELDVTLAHDPCMFGDDLKLHQQELRHILRMLNVGKPGYKWLKIVPPKKTSDDDNIFYYAKISNVSYRMFGNDVIGLIVKFQCDGGFAYSEEKSITISAAANTPFTIYNHSDDYNNYLLPVTQIKLGAAGTFTITNQTDNNWVVSLKNNNKNEVITMQSDKEIITSTRGRSYILSDLDPLHFIRLLPDKNVLVTNMAATITFTYREPRKVGFVA